MIDEPFRERIQPLLTPVVNVLARSGVTPNHVTILSFVVALAAALVIALDHPVVGIGVWLVSRVGDAVDGALARAAGATTPFGGFLDITLDMTAYSAIVAAFAWVYPQYAALWTLVLVGYVVAITTTLALSDAAGVLQRRVSATDRTFQFTRAIAEGGETNVMYVVWALWPEYLSWWLTLWIAALAATGVQRTRLAWRVLR
jgi:phosphatidylglycerophosphate synthase